MCEAGCRGLEEKLDARCFQLVELRPRWLRILPALMALVIFLCPRVRLPCLPVTACAWLSGAGKYPG